MNFWDCAGESIYHDVRKEFYKDVDGVLFVFDISDRLSFQRLDKWVADMKAYCQPNVKTILVGNKADVSESKITPAEVDEFVKSLSGCEYFETSAKTQDRIKEIFEVLFKKCLDSQ